MGFKFRLWGFGGEAAALQSPLGCAPVFISVAQESLYLCI